MSSKVRSVTCFTRHSESCWKLTYGHDAAGNPLEGSLQDLLDAIQVGHRVKFIYGDIGSVEPDELTFRGGHVTATVLRIIKNDPTDNKSFLSGAQWNWRIQSTTGKVETFSANVGEYVEQERPIGMTPCTWFTDVRQRNLKLINDNTGAVQAGGKSDLTDAIRDGAKIRYILADNSDRLITHEADNLAISGSEVGAMHNRSVELMGTMNSNTEVSFPLVDLFYVFKISSTVGEVAMTKWTVEDRVNRGRSITTAGMTWFADI